MLNGAKHLVGGGGAASPSASGGFSGAQNDILQRFRDSRHWDGERDGSRCQGFSIWRSPATYGWGKPNSTTFPAKRRRALHAYRDHMGFLLPTEASPCRPSSLRILPTVAGGIAWIRSLALSRKCPRHTSPFPMSGCPSNSFTIQTAAVSPVIHRGTLGRRERWPATDCRPCIRERC